MNKQLSIYLLPSLKIGDVVTHHGMPSTVLSITQKRDAVQLDTPDGKVRVTKNDLQRKALLMAYARSSYRKVIKTFNEGEQFIYQRKKT